MSPLAKEIIEKLNKENDTQVLTEVLDFYDYLKQKKNEEYIMNIRVQNKN